MKRIISLMFALAFVFMGALSYAQTYQKPQEQEIFHYVFQKGDNPWKVLKENYGYANEALADSFLAENKITLPKKIRIGAVVILHKNLIDTQMLKAVFQKNAEKRYEDGINFLETENKTLIRKIKAYETAIQLYNQLLEFASFRLKTQEGFSNLFLALGILIGFMVGALASGFVVNAIVRNKSAATIQKNQEENGKTVNNLINGIGLLQREKLRLAKAFSEAKDKEQELAEKIKWFEARQPGKTVALKVGNNKYPVVIVGWNLIEGYKDKISSPLGRKYGKELVFCCPECGKVLVTPYGIRLHWEDNHSDEKRNALLAEDMQVLTVLS